jgi:methanethiol S-methyltransferase
MKRIFALTYGMLAYTLFGGTFLYAVLFVGNVWLSKTIDSGPQASLATTIAIDLALLGVFAVQHSLMARKGFKRIWTRVVPSVIERATYVVTASLALALIEWQWKPIPASVWDLRGSVAEPVILTLFWSGWGLVLLSSFLVNHFELFGLAQVWNYASNRKPSAPVFKTPALYRVVRHPLYFGFVIGFWATPRMTVGHLLFSIGTTGYILLGIYFEERDLISTYGQRYRQYRERVPMLIPFLKRSEAAQKQPNTKTA